MEKSVEGGSAEEACRAATIGESLNQDASEIEAWRSDARRDATGSCTTNAQVGQGLLAPPQQTGAPPRIFTRSQAAATGSDYCGERPTGAEASAESC